jgi:hypothetical protein
MHKVGCLLLSCVPASQYQVIKVLLSSRLLCTAVDTCSNATEYSLGSARDCAACLYCDVMCSAAEVDCGTVEPHLQMLAVSSTVRACRLISGTARRFCACLMRRFSAAVA